MKLFMNKHLSSEVAHEMYDRAKAFGLSPLTYNATEIITEDIGDHWIQLESFHNKNEYQTCSRF